MLANVGLENLIADTRAAYVDRAAELAADLEGLKALRGGLRARMAESVLLDAAGFTRNLEAAYRRMWIDWCGAAARPSDPRRTTEAWHGQYPTPYSARPSICIARAIWPQAEAACRAILAADPTACSALHLLGVIALRSGHPQHALEHLAAAVNLDALQAAFHATLGEAYGALGQSAAAIASFRHAVELMPQQADFHFRLGKLLETHGEAAAAGLHFAETLRLAPGHVDAALHLGQTLFSQGKLAEAEERFEATARAASRVALGTLRLGVRVLRPGTISICAIACYRRAIEIQPSFAEAHFNLGMALHSQDRSDRSDRLFRSRAALHAVARRRRT